MSISEVGPLRSDEYLPGEVDENGNLKDFVVADGTSSCESESLGETTESIETYKRKRAEGEEKANKKAKAVLDKAFSSENMRPERQAKKRAICKNRELIKKMRDIDKKLESEGDESYDPWDNRCLKLMFSFKNALMPKPVYGREKEIEAILSMIMQPSQGMRPLLAGPLGVGIQTLVRGVAKELKTTLKDQPLGDRSIYCIDISEIMATCEGENKEAEFGDTLREIIKKTYQRIKPSPIFYIRDIDRLFTNNEDSHHLREYTTVFFEAVLKKPHSFIASISREANSETVKRVQRVLTKYKFALIPVEELPLNHIQTIVKNHFKEAKCFKGLTLTEGAIDLGIRLADKYETGSPFPGKAIDLINLCCARSLLAQIKSGMPMMNFVISEREIAEEVSKKTNIPASDLLDKSIFNQERFEKRLRAKIIGQDHAIRLVSNHVAFYKMNLVSRRKPWGVFLFVGPTGVGKTELASSLAKLLFNNESNLLFLNGSEFKEDYTISNLIGSPQGYEGHEVGGFLTEALKKNPHQVIILDEFEKSHENVRKLFLSVFDRGILRDRKDNVEVDCSSAIFIMTSNVGSKELLDEMQVRELSSDDVMDFLMPHLREAFSPELVGRFSRGIVPFNPLDRGLMPSVAEVTLRQIREDLITGSQIELSWTPELIQHFSQLDVSFELGWRAYCKRVEEEVKTLIKDAMLSSRQRITGKIEITWLPEKEKYSLSVG